MLKNSLIIMPFHLPWDHSADYQKQTCVVLNKYNNTVVCYMQQHAHFILKPQPRIPKYPKYKNIHFFIPKYIIPFRRFAFIDKLNQLINIFFISIRYRFKKQKIILWLFDPRFYFYPLVKKLNTKVISLYDCVDYHWSRVEEEAKKIRQTEKKLIKNVDKFVVNSHTLYNLHKRVRKPDAIVPLGFDLETFKKHHNDTPIVKFPKDKSIIGYVGAINHRLDFKLLKSLIKNNPQWQFVLWGPIQETEPNDIPLTRKFIRKISKYSNVILGSSKLRIEISGIIKQYDVCIIPYNIELKANLYCYPMKLLEYFYVGKPVISTPIEELKRFPKFVKIGKNAPEWDNHIKELISKTWPESYMREQKKLAIENSWEKKVKHISLRL